MADKMSVEQALACLSAGHSTLEALATLRAEIDGLRAKSSRAYVAEQMRGLVAKKTSPDSYHSNERARARVWNACRAETLANIERWEQSHD